MSQVRKLRNYFLKICFEVLSASLWYFSILVMQQYNSSVRNTEYLQIKK